MMIQDEKVEQQEQYTFLKKVQKPHEKQSVSPFILQKVVNLGSEQLTDCKLDSNQVK